MKSINFPELVIGVICRATKARTPKRPLRQWCPRGVEEWIRTELNNFSAIRLAQVVEFVALLSVAELQINDVVTL